MSMTGGADELLLESDGNCLAGTKLDAIIGNKNNNIVSTQYFNLSEKSMLSGERSVQELFFNWKNQIINNGDLRERRNLASRMSSI